jgi:hypothetical protein
MPWRRAANSLRSSSRGPSDSILGTWSNSSGTIGARRREPSTGEEGRKMTTAEREKAWKMILALIDGQRGEVPNEDMFLMFQAVKDAGVVPEAVMFFPLDYWFSGGGCINRRSVAKKLREYGNAEMAALSKDREKYETTCQESKKVFREYLGEYLTVDPKALVIYGRFTVSGGAAKEIPRQP